MNFKKIALSLIFILNTYVSGYNAPKYTHDLARANFKLVPYFAKPFFAKYKLSRYNREELLQEGYVGLMYACRKYDDSKNVMISTYSSYWIRSYMDKYIKRLHKYKEPVLLNEDISRTKDYTSIIDLDILISFERDIIVKRYIERKTINAVAKEYGVSDNTIVRYSKIAVSKLRDNIEE